MQEHMERATIVIVVGVATFVPTLVSGEMGTQPTWLRALMSAVVAGATAGIALTLLRRFRRK